MPRDPRTWLSDVLAACDLLADFTRGKSFEDYAADALLRSAVERQLEMFHGDVFKESVYHICYGSTSALVGFGFHADACAPGILALLDRVREQDGLVVALGCGRAC